MSFFNKITIFVDMEKEHRAIIGEILQTSRVQQGLSLEYVAEQVGCKPATLSKIENGTFSLNIDMLIPIIRVLNIKMTLNDEKV